MRKVTYGGANSVDNFITGPGESIGWLRMTADVQALMKESWKGVDTMLMGRKTFEFAQKMGGGPADMGKIKTYVFSRTMESAPEGVELVSGDAVEFVRELKSKPGGNIIVMGGGELGSALIDGGVVDEIGLNIHPLLLGGGTPLFRPLGRRVELELVEARPIAGGCLYALYRVKGPAD
jgi:dihydrofolate reductase